MKICSKCKIKKSLTNFYKMSKSKDGHQVWCKNCNNKKRMECYYEKPEVNKLNHYRRVQRNKEWMLKYLEDKKCVDCKIDDYRVLQFDHVRGQKTEDISTMVCHGWGLETIKKEIEKCEIRCANCHQIKTIHL